MQSTWTLPTIKQRPDFNLLAEQDQLDVDDYVACDIGTLCRCIGRDMPKGALEKIKQAGIQLGHSSTIYDAIEHGASPLSREEHIQAIYHAMTYRSWTPYDESSATWELWNDFLDRHDIDEKRLFLDVGNIAVDEDNTLVTLATRMYYTRFLQIDCGKPLAIPEDQDPEDYVAQWRQQTKDAFRNHSRQAPLYKIRDAFDTFKTEGLEKALDVMGREKTFDVVLDFARLYDQRTAKRMVQAAIDTYGTNITEDSVPGRIFRRIYMGILEDMTIDVPRPDQQCPDIVPLLHASEPVRRAQEIEILKLAGYALPGMATEVVEVNPSRA